MAAQKMVDHATTIKGSARLEARISPEQKSILVRAAALEGRTVTDYIVAHLIPIAAKAIQERDVIKLSPRDSELFVRTLLNPPEPNENLIRAWEDYHKTLGV